MVHIVSLCDHFSHTAKLLFMAYAQGRPAVLSTVKSEFHKPSMETNKFELMELEIFEAILLSVKQIQDIWVE